MKANRGDERKELWRLFTEEELLELRARQRVSPGKISGTMRLAAFEPPDRLRGEPSPSPQTRTGRRQVASSHASTLYDGAKQHDASSTDGTTDEFGGILRNDTYSWLPPETDVATIELSQMGRRMGQAENDESALFGMTRSVGINESMLGRGAETVAHLARRSHSADVPVPIQRKQSHESLTGERNVDATSSGAALPEEIRAKMEDVLGMDFSAVRVHEGPQAASVGALAFTRGTDIFFAPGQYQPQSQRGQELLGHELTHVRQQASGVVGTSRDAGGVSINDDAGLEREADIMGAQAARSTGTTQNHRVRDRSSHILSARAPNTGDHIQRKIVNNSATTIYYKPEQGNAALAVPEKSALDVDIDGVATHKHKDRAYKVVDGTDATVDENGDVDRDSGGISSAIGNLFIGGWKDEDWLKKLQEKNDHGWDSLFDAACKIEEPTPATVDKSATTKKRDGPRGKTYQNAELDRQEEYGNKGAIDYMATLEQTKVSEGEPIPLPDRVGYVDYYRARYNDFVKRNADNENNAPSYYLEYGEKYAKRFTNILFPKLSEKGKQWLVKARTNLQLAIENRLLKDPAGFAQLERDDEAFRRFCFDSHVPAYLDAGLNDLSSGDMYAIATTPDLGDLLSKDGLRQVIDIAPAVLFGTEEKEQEEE